MLSTPAWGQTKERRLYQVDSVGNVQYHKPSFTIQKDGRIIETDTVGNKQYHKQQYVIVGDKVLLVDSVGNASVRLV